MILLTGPSTFAGRNLLLRLKAEGQSIRCYDWFKRRDQDPDAEFFYGNLLTPAQLKKVLQGVDTVFHCMDIKRPDSAGRRHMKKVNIKGTENLLEASAAVGVSRFIFLSTHSVCGGRNPFRMMSGKHKEIPVTAYGRDKLKAEDICRQYSGKGKMSVTVIRPAAILSPGTKDPASLACMYMAAGMGTENRFYIYSYGETRYQLLHIEDAVDCIVKAWKAPAAAGKTYSIGTENVPSRKEEIRVLLNTGRLSFKPLLSGKAPTAIRHLLMKMWGARLFTGEHYQFLRYGKIMDCSAAEKDLDWHPTKNNTEIILETFSWYLKEKLKQKLL